MENTIRSIDLAGWTESGEGSTAKTYNNNADEGIMLKLFLPYAFGEDASEEEKFGFAQKEYDMTKAIIKLGLNAPDALELVSVNGMPGVIYERIPDKKSFSRIISESPERLEEITKRFAAESKKLHSTQCEPGVFPDLKARYLDVLVKAKFLDKEDRKEAITRIMELPDVSTCLHGDLNMSNILLSGDKSYWIDLSDFSCGSSWLDIGTVYFMFKVRDKVKDELFHVSIETLEKLWDVFLPAYFGTDDPKVLARAEETARKYCFVFMLRTCDEGHTRRLPYEVLSNVIHGLIRDAEFTKERK